MTSISAKNLTLEDFLSQYRDNPCYELADGELIDMEPTEPHETGGWQSSNPNWYLPCCTTTPLS